MGRKILYRDVFMTGWAYKICSPEDLRTPVVTGEGKRVSCILGLNLNALWKFNVWLTKQIMNVALHYIKCSFPFIESSPCYYWCDKRSRGS